MRRHKVGLGLYLLPVQIMLIWALITRPLALSPNYRGSTFEVEKRDSLGTWSCDSQSCVSWRGGVLCVLMPNVFCTCGFQKKLFIHIKHIYTHFLTWHDLKLLGAKLFFYFALNVKFEVIKESSTLNNKEIINAHCASMWVSYHSSTVSYSHFKNRLLQYLSHYFFFLT